MFFLQKQKEAYHSKCFSTLHAYYSELLVPIMIIVVIIYQLQTFSAFNASNNNIHINTAVLLLCVLLRKE